MTKHQRYNRSPKGLVRARRYNRSMKGKDRDRSRSARRRGARESEPVTLRGIYERDHGTCALCGWSVPSWDDASGDDPDARATIDHVVPCSAGGPHTWTNCRLAHAGCNRRRGVGPPPA